MNSSLLNKLHPEVYKKFFNENQIVFSLPIVMDRNLGWFSPTRWLFSKQKIPLRIYVWLSESKNFEWYNFHTITTYNHESWEFIFREVQSMKSNSKTYFSSISEYLLSNYYTNKGVNINILMETSQTYDLGRFWVLLLWIMLAINFFHNKLTLNDIMETIEGDINNVYYNHEVGKIISESWRLSHQLSGYLKFNTMVTSYFHWENQFFSYRDVFYIEDRISKNQELNFYGKKVDNFSQKNDNNFITSAKNHTWSFDLHLLYSGFPIQENKKYLQDIQMGEYLKEHKANISKKLNDNSTTETSNSILQSYLNQETPNLNDAHRIISDSINLEIQNSLILLIDDEYKNNALDKLIGAVNKVSKLFSIFCDHGKKFLKLIRFIENYCKADENEVGVFPFDIIQWWGCITLISPLESNRKRVEQMVLYYKTLHPDSYMSIIYESRKDGLEYEWVKIEQDLKSWIFSPCISWSAYKITHHDGSIELLTNNDISSSFNDEVVLDTISSKIYIQGQKITSKDLFSQSSTCDVLQILLQNPWISLSNAKFPPSSYSRNKWDMISKVIVPIKELIKNHLGKILDIECIGNGTSYTMKYTPSKVSFGIISKIQ